MLSARVSATVTQDFVAQFTQFLAGSGLRGFIHLPSFLTYSMADLPMILVAFEPSVTVTTSNS